MAPIMNHINAKGLFIAFFGYSALAFSFCGCAGFAARGVAGGAAMAGSRMGAVRIGAATVMAEAATTDAVAMRVGSLGASRLATFSEARSAGQVLARNLSGESIGTVEAYGHSTTLVRDSARNLILRTIRDGDEFVHANSNGRRIGVTHRQRRGNVTVLRHYVDDASGGARFVGEDAISDGAALHYDAKMNYIGRTMLGSNWGGSGAQSINVDVAALAAAAVAIGDNR